MELPPVQPYKGLIDMMIRMRQLIQKVSDADSKSVESLQDLCQVHLQIFNNSAEIMAEGLKNGTVVDPAAVDKLQVKIFGVGFLNARLESKDTWSVKDFDLALEKTLALMLIKAADIKKT